jgi:hypothetical protein
MATSPVPVWAQEMSPHHRGPTGAGVLALAVIVVLVVLVLSAIPTAESGAQPRRGVDTKQGVSLCEEHPGWSVCKESSRGR